MVGIGGASAGAMVLPALCAYLFPPYLLSSAVGLGVLVARLGAIAGIFAPEVVAVGGWQGLFVVPGLAAAVIALALGYLLRSGVPETPSRARGARLPQLDLVKAPWLLPFGVFAVILSLNAMNLYYFNSWLPTVLPLAEFTIDEAARVSGVVQLAGIAIGVAASLGVDRWRPSLTLILMFGAMAVAFAAIGLTAPDPLRWTLLLLAGAGAISGAGMALPALTAYLFPSRLLSSAVGMGVLVARVGAISGPLIGTAMLDAGVSPRLFLASAALPAGLAALICLGIPAALAVRRNLAADT
jgi:AAHS family 4-hydroxybenzoate transporter-like MFS transporter